mmetsp:Transcript_49488/g.138570  ORF Transcript_49488/g.138570 Transcript_49488/m.138570 type:complete len:241 (-) Transcript_49488:944-1666(-)
MLLQAGAERTRLFCRQQGRVQCPGRSRNYRDGRVQVRSWSCRLRLHTGTYVHLRCTQERLQRSAAQRVFRRRLPTRALPRFDRLMLLLGVRANVRLRLQKAAPSHVHQSLRGGDIHSFERRYPSRTRAHVECMPQGKGGPKLPVGIRAQRDTTRILLHKGLGPEHVHHRSGRHEGWRPADDARVQEGRRPFKLSVGVEREWYTTRDVLYQGTRPACVRIRARRDDSGKSTRAEGVLRGGG